MNPTHESTSGAVAAVSPADTDRGVSPEENADLTRTCQQPSTFTTAALVGTLEHAWSAIRTRHPDVPASVIVIGSGSPATASQSLKYGHFANLRWQAGDHRLPEVLISGEGLSRTADEVFTTLLHEAAHGLADTRGIKDTSRQGRWHNKQFANLAAELGMAATKDDKLGYSPCTLTDATAARYRTVIADIATALRAWRHPEPTGEAKGRTNNNNGLTCECVCPRKLRISIAAFEAGPIGCAVCGTWFLPADVDRDAYTTEHPLPADQTASGHHDCIDRHQADEEDDPMTYYDPTGVRYGLPTYPFKFAPDGLATVRQLRAQGLRPGGQDIAAQIMWRRGKRVAYLYRIDKAAPKRAATPAQRQAIDRALAARRTCPTCHQVRPYYIPRRTGECLACTATPSTIERSPA
jgi:hypothetical protein